MVHTKKELKIGAVVCLAFSLAAAGCSFAFDRLAQNPENATSQNELARNSESLGLAGVAFLWLSGTCAVRARKAPAPQ